MKKTFLAALASLMLASSLAAVPLRVAWADGKVERQKGAAWTAVGIGDQVDSSDTIRLAAGASVEITDGKRKVALTAAGQYKLDELLKQGSEMARKKVGALDKLGKLVDPKASAASSTVAAVRGSPQGQGSDSVTWMVDEVDVAAVMDEGRALVRDGDFSAAAAKFDEAVLAADGVQKAEAAYAEAWALAADDRTGQAVKLLRGMAAAGQWEGPRVLLLSRLDLDTGSAKEAASLLKSGIDAKLFAGDDLELAKAMLTESAGK
jgi:hypothetical protein